MGPAANKVYREVTALHSQTNVRKLKNKFSLTTISHEIIHNPSSPERTCPVNHARIIFGNCSVRSSAKKFG
jgi:hypothetical protein